MDDLTPDAGISAYRLQELRTMIASGTARGFYDWADWVRVREFVFSMDNWECQHCKSLGRYRRAKLVHHVKHLKNRPDLALSVFDPDTGQRQLVSLCRACHEDEHPERRRGCFAAVSSPLTPERWD